MIYLLAYCSGRNIIQIAVMAGLTLSGYTNVTKVRCWLKRYTGSMAETTILIGWQMGCGLSGECVTCRGETGVMARCAVITQYARVVKCRADKRCDAVTVHAILGIGDSRKVV